MAHALYILLRGRIGRALFLAALFFPLLTAATLEVVPTQVAPTDVELEQYRQRQKQRKAKQPPAPPEQLDGAALQDPMQLKDLNDLKSQVNEIRNAQKGLPALLKSSTDQAAALRTVEKRLSVQVQKNTMLQAWVELLTLTTLLACGAFLFCLLQLRALRALVRTGLEKPPPIESKVEPLPNGSSAGVSGASRGEEGPSPPAQSREKIAQLLSRLRQEALRLAEGFEDRSTQVRFLGDFDAPLKARLDRLRIYSAQGEAQLREHWLGPDLVTTLDALARFYSEAVAEERRGHKAARSLARKLRAWLYVRFNSACEAEGWFSIDPIEPYRTIFDPNFHHAETGPDGEGAMVRIIAIKAIGRRNPKSGDVIHKAEVIVER